MDVRISHDAPASLVDSIIGRYVLAVLIGIDVCVNAVLGGQPYQTISCRIGESINSNGLAAHIPLPAWFSKHCKNSVFEAIV